MRSIAVVHREITAAVVEDAERLIALGFPPADIAERLEISEYVVRVIAGDSQRTGRPAPRESKRRHPNARRSIDVATVRLIRRMLAAGSTAHREIARHAGVSDSTVSAIAGGLRHLGDGMPPLLEAGERFCPEGVRCSTCGATLVVVPCRACRILAN